MIIPENENSILVVIILNLRDTLVLYCLTMNTIDFTILT